uniref:Uncharacterized protein n=1 Tax=Salix viminalis TaxID=40686 RepID=A0A6N2N904_SALVM
MIHVLHLIIFPVSTKTCFYNQPEPPQAPKALMTVIQETEEEMALKALWTVERKAGKGMTSGTSLPAREEGNCQYERLDGREEYLRGWSGLKDKGEEMASSTRLPADVKNEARVSDRMKPRTANVDGQDQARESETVTPTEA